MDSPGVYESRYKILSVSALSAFIATLDASIVNVSLPTLARFFGVEISMVAWVILGYSMTITSTLLIVGRMAVRKGYRFTYRVGFSLFTLGSLFCALSGGIEWLILFRFIQGLGASFLMASGPALITRAFPVRERGRGMGIMGTVVGAGLMSGPPLGGFLVSTLGWHSIFIINLPIGIGGFIAASRFLKIVTPDNQESRIDWLGGLFQAVTVSCLLLFFNRMNGSGWPPELIYGVLGVAIMGLILFLWREYKCDEALVGLAIFKHRQFSLAIGALLVLFICNSSGMVLIPFFLEEVMKLGPLDVGLVLVTIPICTLIVAPLAGRVADAIGYRLLTVTGVMLFILGALLLTTLDASSSRFDVVIRLIAIGIGIGMFMAPNSTALMSSVPRPLVGIASSILAVSRNLGLSSGVAIATSLFTYYRVNYEQTRDDVTAFIDSFHIVVTIFAVTAFISLTLALIRKNRVDIPG